MILGVVVSGACVFDCPVDWQVSEEKLLARI